MTKLISAKCLGCGANLEFPETMEVGHCMHCGAKVIIDKEVHIHGQTAIACPDCGGHGFFPCMKVGYADDVSGLEPQQIGYSMRSVRLLLHPVIVETICDNQPHNAEFMMAAGCDTSGKCTVIKVKQAHSRTAGKYFETPIYIYNGNMCRNGKCDFCGGSGKIGFFSKGKCPNCSGTGLCKLCKGTAVCTKCKGTGKIKCDTCNGTGFKVYKG